MSEIVGAKIKEARKGAGLTQEELGEKIGVSAKTISKVEHGEKELTEEQLQAVAEATGVPVESLQETEQVAAPELTDEEILSLYKSADPATQNAAVSTLKGETNAQDANPMAAMMSMFGGMMGGQNGEGGENAQGENAQGGDAMASMMSMFGGMMGGQNGEGGNAEGGANPMAAMMSMFGGMMGGQNAQGAEQGKDQEEKKEE